MTIYLFLIWNPLNSPIEKSEILSGFFEKEILFCIFEHSVIG